jgi:hypothetical protein
MAISGPLYPQYGISNVKKREIGSALTGRFSPPNVVVKLLTTAISNAKMGLCAFFMNTLLQQGCLDKMTCK